MIIIESFISSLLSIVDVIEDYVSLFSQISSSMNKLYECGWVDRSDRDWCGYTDLTHTLHIRFLKFSSNPNLT